MKNQIYLNILLKLTDFKFLTGLTENVEENRSLWNLLKHQLFTTHFEMATMLIQH